MSILKRLQHELQAGWTAIAEPTDQSRQNVQTTAAAETTEVLEAERAAAKDAKRAAREADLEQARKAGTAAGARAAEHDMAYSKVDIKHFTMFGSKRAQEAAHEARKAAGKFMDYQWEYEYRFAFDKAYKAHVAGLDA